MKTKKITTYLLATACAAVFASCDMDLRGRVRFVRHG